MLIGYNNDVEYRGKEFHIQTEDHGTGTAKIESQLFHAGQILDTKFVDYEDVLEEAPESEHESKIEERMQSVHVGLYKKLMNGEYDEMVGLEPIDDPEEVDAPDPDEFTPAQERVPAAAAQVEEGGQDALEQFHAQEANKHSDLDSLKEKLGDEEPEEGDELDDISDPEISLEDSAESDVATGAASTEGGGAEQEVAEEQNTGDAAASLREQISREERKADHADGELDPSVLELPTTGARAWSGCAEPDGDLAIDELVEAEFDG